MTGIASECTGLPTTHCAGKSKKTLGKPNNAAVGPEKTLSRQNFKRKVV
jgi:hypothetical protein